MEKTLIDHFKSTELQSDLTGGVGRCCCLESVKKEGWYKTEHYFKRKKKALLGIVKRSEINAIESRGPI